jgi:hypothetical protein
MDIKREVAPDESLFDAADYSGGKAVDIGHELPKIGAKGIGKEMPKGSAHRAKPEREVYRGGD